MTDAEALAEIAKHITSPMTEPLAEIAKHLTSPNVLDANWEQANITDAVAKIAFAIYAQAEAIEKLADAVSGEHGGGVAEALNRIADFMPGENGK